MLRNWKTEVPIWAVGFAFLLTVVIARSISTLWPRIGWWFGTARIHHYVFGIFILTAAGYLSLVFKGPRATSWIALLYGLGVGLTFDEFGFWFNPPFQRGVRWSYSGLAIIVLMFVLISLIPVLRRIRKRAAYFQSSFSQGTACRNPSTNR